MTVRIHTYAATPDKFFVNSFLVETDTGLVLIDTQFLVSSAQELVAKTRVLNKKLEAVIISHPHPDHYNGLPIVLEAFGPMPVYANAPTIAGIKATRAAKREAWTPVYGTDYPTTDAIPDHEIGPDVTLTLAGTEFRVLGLGAGECSENTVIHIPAAGTLIASDLIYSRCHPWLAEHRSDAWLEQIDRVEETFESATAIHGGHGPAGGREKFGEQRDYITAFKASVAAHAKGALLSEEALAAIKAEVTRGRDGWPLEALISMNAAGIADELGELGELELAFD